MKIGITGATGFLGSSLIEYLLDKKYKIFALTRDPSKVFQDKKLKFLIGDLNSKPDCKKFVNKVDKIIHLAHSNSPITSNNDVIGDTMLNLIPSLNLLEAIKESGKKHHFIFASSGGAIYGASKNKMPFKEDYLCKPMSSYGIQKNTIENYIRMYCDFGYMTSTVLRISNPYGFLLPEKRKQGLIGVVLNRLLVNKKIHIYGNSQNIRDYIHLDDVNKAFELSLSKTGGFNVYNIGLGQGYSVDDILNLIQKYTGKEIRRKQIDTQEAKTLCEWAVLDVSKAKKELSWSPKIEIQEGIKNLCNQTFNKG